MSEDLSGLNLVELYDRLIQPEVPPPLSMWPQTAGWLWLGAALLLLTLFAVWKFYTWRRATAYRRAALAALKEAGDDPVAISDVLRRTALAGFPRAEVAQLYGSDWLAFLDHSVPSGGFAGSEAGQVLAAAPHRPQAPNRDLPALAESWIKTHRQEGAR